MVMFFYYQIDSRLKCPNMDMSIFGLFRLRHYKKCTHKRYCECIFCCGLLILVELAIAEMACVSSNVRRTLHVPSGVRVQRSISGRDVSHPIRLEQKVLRISV